MEDNSHVHCTTCIKSNCTLTKACGMVFCPVACGFRMHACKLDDHMLICSKQIVPCSNAIYGCPARLQRDKIGKHLTVCPASVVFCTMEWNRYPLYSKSRLSWVPFFQPNPVLVKGQLDVELALRDQKVLEEVFKKRLRKGKSKVDILRLNRRASSVGDESESERNLNQKEFSSQINMAIALSSLENQMKPLESKAEKSSLNLDDVRREKEEKVKFMFLKSKSGILPSEDIFIENSCTAERVSSLSESLPQLVSEQQQLGFDTLSNTRGSDEDSDGFIPENEKSSQTHEFEDVQLYNANKTEYKQLQDQPFDLSSIPDQSESFPVEEQQNQSDEVLSVPPEFVDIHLEEPLGLNVMLETLPKFQKQLPMYSIPCNQIFRRNEYGSHFKNVHSEIHGGLNGWLEHRCPLAQYGCTFIHHRLLPGNQCGQVIFNQDLGSFGIRPCVRNTEGPINGSPECPHLVLNKTDTDFLSSLPLEILEKIALMLDGFSLCNFSRTSKMLREVSQRIVEKKGMVTLEWEKRIYDHGLWSWQIRQKKWFFSTAFTPVDSWEHSNSPGMAAHLEKCRFFKQYISTQEQFCYHQEVMPFSHEQTRNICCKQVYTLTMVPESLVFNSNST